jgi:hypothetical protein
MQKAFITILFSAILIASCTKQVVKTSTVMPIDTTQCEKYPERDFLPVANNNVPNVLRFHDNFYQTKRPRYGQVDALFQIDTGGVVTACAINTSTLNDLEFEDQLITKLKRWRFPSQTASRDYVDCFTFTYSIIFGR